MTIRVISCDNFGIGTAASHVIDAKEYPWTARVSADILVYVKVHAENAARSGTLAFSGVATDDDEVALLFDGGEESFVFGDGTGGTVDKGVTATTSAQNLKTAIAAYVLANGLDLTISGAGATLTFTTNDRFIDIEEVVDDGPVMTVTAFNYTALATADDAPFSEFDDLFFAVGYGEGLSFLGYENDGFCSVAEVKISTA